MASTLAAYPNSDCSNSGKVKSVSPFRLLETVRYSGAPRHLRATVLAMIAASDKPGLVLWPAVQGVMIEAGVCRRTVQRNLRRLVREGWLEAVHFEGKPDLWNVWVNKDHFRRSATYRVNVAKFRSHPRQKEINSSEWRTYSEYKASQKKKPQAHRSSRLAPVSSLPPAPPAPPTNVQSELAASPMRPPHRDGKGITRAEDRAQRLRAELVSRARFYQQGVTAIVEPVGGLKVQLHPGDARYVKPLPGHFGVLAACTSLVQGDAARGFDSRGLTRDEAFELAKEAGLDWIPREHGP